MQDNDFARVKSNKWASDDDAGDLLAGILSETEDLAKEEEARMQAEIAAREAAENAAKDAEERQKRAEAAEKLNAELNRLEQVEQRRTAKLEALKIEDLKERGEWIDPEIERRRLEEEARSAAEAAAREAAAQQAVAQQMTMPQGAQAPAPKSSNSMLFVVAGLALLLIAGAVGTVLALQFNYTVDAATYSKSVFTPKAAAVAMVEKGIQPIPKAAPVAVASSDETKSSKRSKSKSRRASSSRSKPKAKSKKPKTNVRKAGKKNKAAAELDKMLKGGDPFGGGGF